MTTTTVEETVYIGTLAHVGTDNMHHVGDIGTTFRFTVLDSETGDVIQLQTYTELLVYLMKPDGSVVEKTASLTGNGSDGKLEWTTTDANDLDTKGRWRRWAKVTISAGTFTTSPIHFVVKDNDS